MNLLSQLLPGLRDVRTPFAVGILSLLTLWALSFLVPAKYWAAESVQQIVDGLSGSQSLLVTSVLVFLVYVSGIFLEATFRFIGDVFLNVAGLALFVALPVAALKLIAPSNIALWFLIISFILTALIRYWVQPEQSFRHHLGELGSIVFRVCMLGLQRAFTEVRTAFVPSFYIARDLVDTELERYYAQFSESVIALIRTASPLTLHSALDAVFPNEMKPRTELQGIINEVASGGQLESRTQVEKSSNYEVARRARIDEGLDHLVREALVLQLSRSSASRKAFARACLDFPDLEEALRKRVAWAELRLRAEHEGVFSEVDRVKSEGDFRRAIAIPMTALIVSAGFRVNMEMSVTDAGGVALMFGIAVGAILLVTGKRKNDEARGMLYSCVRNELLKLEPHDLTVHMVALKRNPYIYQLADDVFSAQPINPEHKLGQVLFQYFKARRALKKEKRREQLARMASSIGIEQKAAE